MNLRKAALVFGLSILGAGCAPKPQYFKSPEIPGSIRDFLKGKTIFVMPANNHMGEASATNPWNLAFFAGMQEKMSDYKDTTIIAGQILIDVVEAIVPNISFSLAEGILWAAHNDKWTFEGGEYAEVPAGIVKVLELLGQKANDMLKDKSPLPDPFQVDYILASHMHEESKGFGPFASLRFEIWGGIYDVKTSRIACAGVVWADSAKADKPDDITDLKTVSKMNKIRSAAGTLFDFLLTGSPDGKPTEGEKKASFRVFRM